MKTLMEKIADPDNLYEAWRRVRANRGGPGVDAVRLEDFEADLPRHLQMLATTLRDETYVPVALRSVTIPKKDGGERTLAIPTIADRVAQRAFVNVLDPIFEPLFLPCSFGYRVGRGVPDAVEQVLRYRSAGFDWMVDADIQDFFGSVDHALLQESLRRHIVDRAVLRTIGLWLEGGVMHRAETRVSLLSRAARQVRTAAQALSAGIGDEDEAATDAGGMDWERARRMAQVKRFGEEALRLAWEYRRVLLPVVAAKGGIALGVGAAVVGGVVAADLLLRKRRESSPSAHRPTGTPQGGPISPLLSNLYLHPFDQAMTARGLRLVRYADDFVLCCPSDARARHAWQAADEELARLRLTLHPDKTRIVPCGDAMRFLGYAFDADGAFPVDEGDEAEKRGARPASAVTARLRDGSRAAKKAVKRAGRQVFEEIHERWEERQREER